MQIFMVSQLRTQPTEYKEENVINKICPFVGLGKKKCMGKECAIFIDTHFKGTDNGVCSLYAMAAEEFIIAEKLSPKKSPSEWTYKGKKGEKS